MRSVAAPVPHPILEDLEPRILYSADNPAVILAVTLHDPGGVGHEYSAMADAPLQQARPAVELVFIDSRVADSARLFADVALQAAAGRSIEALTLAADEDGIAQIGAALAGRTEVSAIHILSHGSEADLQLGNIDLTNDSLLQRAADIAGWSSHLGKDADLLLYGCDLAAGADGRALIDGLAMLSGANVAASTDLTGSALLGADWVLEANTGRIDSALAIDAAGQAQWQGTLAANQAPVLTPIAPMLRAIHVDEKGYAAQTVASFIDSSINDPDGSGLAHGIAITSTTAVASTPAGSAGWQISRDSGKSWTALGSVGPDAAVLLRSTDLIRLAPDAAAAGTGTGVTHTASITYLAWDETSGSAGGTANTTIHGGTSAFSAASDTATIKVIAPALATPPVDAPVDTPVVTPPLTPVVPGAPDTGVPAQGTGASNAPPAPQVPQVPPQALASNSPSLPAGTAATAASTPVSSAAIGIDKSASAVPAIAATASRFKPVPPLITPATNIDTHTSQAATNADTTPARSPAAPPRAPLHNALRFYGGAGADWLRSLPVDSVRTEVVTPTPAEAAHNAHAPTLSLPDTLTDAASDAKVETRIAVGVALSLGVVSWSVRGATLLASVVVASPAWGSYDLLPVLSRKRGDADWGDDETDEAEEAREGDPEPRAGGLSTRMERRDPLIPKPLA